MTSERTRFRKIARQIDKAQLVRLTKGVYVDPEDLVGLDGDFYRVSLICRKPSAICLLSALQYYGLTEQIFGGVWILVPYKRTPPRSKSIRVVRSRAPRFRTGITNKKTFRITNVERSIVDTFTYSRRLGIDTAVQALKKAIENRMTTKEKVFLMAKKLNKLKKILPYLESL
jgi:predicted transcriptional regulator of viral defense system